MDSAFKNLYGLVKKQDTDAIVGLLGFNAEWTCG
jgi:hypothetical protein